MIRKAFDRLVIPSLIGWAITLAAILGDLPTRGALWDHTTGFERTISAIAHLLGIA